jgi:hypothetical protein
MSPFKAPRLSLLSKSASIAAADALSASFHFSAVAAVIGWVEAVNFWVIGL